MNKRNERAVFFLSFSTLPLQTCFIPKGVFTPNFTQVPFSPATHRDRLTEKGREEGNEVKVRSQVVTCGCLDRACLWQIREFAFTKEVLKAAWTFEPPLAMSDAEQLHLVRERELSASQPA